MGLIIVIAMTCIWGLPGLLAWFIGCFVLGALGCIGEDHGTRS